MREFNPEEIALMDVLGSSEIFGRIAKEIDDFLDKYGVSDWLTLSQVATIHEILMAGNKDEIMKRLEGYKELQLRRASEEDRWQKEKSGKKAIEHFYEMIGDLMEKHLSFIKKEIEESFRLTIDDSYHQKIYQNLIKTFDHIFVTKLRILKDKEGLKCLRG